MFEAITSYLSSVTKLTPKNQVIALLISLIIAIGWWSYSVQGKLETERDNYKDRYEKAYEKLEKLQDTRITSNDTCTARFENYQRQKDKEIQELSNSFADKYNVLLDKYEKLLSK